MNIHDLTTAEHSTMVRALENHAATCRKAKAIARFWRESIRAEEAANRIRRDTLAESRIGYARVVGFRNRNRMIPPPTFPDRCPVCDAEASEEPVTIRKKTGRWGDRSETITPDSRHATYTCGGYYKPVPQIQNHTDYFSGACGLTDWIAGGFQEHEAEEVVRRLADHADPPIRARMEEDPDGETFNTYGQRAEVARARDLLEREGLAAV